MKIVSSRLTGWCLLLLSFMLLSAVQINAQAWNYRAAYGANATGTERASAIAVDAAGNYYITGTFSGSINFGAVSLPTANGSDGFIAKFNSSNVCQWAIRFGSTSPPANLDEGKAIVVTSTSVYVCGTFNTTMTVGSSPTVYTASGVIDGCIIKLDASNGNVNWVTTFGGASTDNAQAICLDNAANPNVYISGNFLTSSTFGSFTRNVVGGGSTFDLFAARLNGATGVFEWVSSGGVSAGNDNVGGSGICFVPSLSEVVVTGSYNASSPAGTGPVYSTTSPVSSVTLPATAGTNDICVLELNATNGAFISGQAAGGTLSDEGLGICFDSFTGDVALAGYFASSSITLGTTPALTNGAGNDDAFYARYNPTTDVFVWSRAMGSTAGADRAVAIASNTNGGIYIAGRFRGTLSVPSTLTIPSITNSRTADDIFLARINVTNGNGQYLAHGAGENVASPISAQANGVAVTDNGSAWITGSFGNGSITFAPLAALPQPGGTHAGADVVVARFNDPSPVTASQSQTGITCNVGCNGTATVTPSGGVPAYTYSWSPSGGTAATATGLCPNNYTVTITDAIGQQTTRNFTISQPVTPLATATTSNPAFPVSANNNIIADASCNLIARLVPNGANPVTGNVNARVWREASVPVYTSPNGKPFVQRHYEITPATSPATATGRLTLYFTQVEFNNFNAHPRSTPDLPTGPGDAAGIAALRIAKYPGQTNNNTGLPGTYPGPATIIDPVDSDIIWNATDSRWEVTFNVVGWSGFIVQTSLTALPVNLIYFTGNINNQDIQLKWQTASETENDYFEVERSVDGRNFSAIGRLAGSNGNSVRNYDLTDAGAAGLSVNKLFYRLKIVSTSGKVEYSNIVVIYLDRKQIFVTGILPNPFGTELYININAPRSGKMDIMLTDMSGKIVVKQQLQVAKGFSTQSVKELGKLGAGVYTLRVDFDGETSVHKVVKQ